MCRLNKIFSRIKNWSPKKKIIVGSIVFAVLAGGATAGLIIWKNGQPVPVVDAGVAEYKPDQTVGKNYPDESSLTVKGMDEIYHGNPLRIEGIHKVEDGGYESFKISGLKNKEIENKINQEIEQAYQELKKLPQSKGTNESRTACGSGAGFGNVLSVECDREDYKSSDYAGSVKTRKRLLNFRLATGEHLKFTDVFTAGTNYGQIITEAYSFTMAGDRDNTRCTSGETDGFCGRYEPVYKADYEEQIVKLVLAFRNQKDVDFSISPSSVQFVVGGKELTYNFKWDYKNVAIYKRFAADNGIYDNDGKLYGFVFEYPQAYVFGKVSDNLFVDCMIYENLYVGSIHDNYMSEAYIKKAGEIIDEAVEGLRSSTTGDEFVIFTCEIMSTEPDPLGSGGNIYRMSKSYFDKTVYDRIVKSNHRARSSMGLYTNPYGDGTEDSNISHSKYFSDVYIFKDGSWTKKTQAQYEKEQQQKEQQQQQKEQQQQQKEQAKLDEEERKQEVAYCRRFGYNTWTKDGGCSGDRHDEPYDSACRTAGYDGGFKGDKLIYCWSDDDDGRFPTSYQSLKQINRE